MVTVPYHIHNFPIPTSTPSEDVAGLRDDVAVTPIGTKRSIASEVGVTIASYAQGLLASTALQASAAGALAYKNGVNDADWSGADLSIANGGTGASSAPAALSALGAATAAQGAKADTALQPSAFTNPAFTGTAKSGGFVSGAFGITKDAEIGSRFVWQIRDDNSLAVVQYGPNSPFPYIRDALSIAEDATVRLSNRLQAPTSVQTQFYGTYLQNQPNVEGSTWYTQGHPNWNIVQTSRFLNPTEWQLYPACAMGICTLPVGTNRVVINSGTSLDAGIMEGLNYLFLDGVVYKVLQVVSPTECLVQTTAGGAVSWPSTVYPVTWYFVATTSTNIVNVNGTSVTRVSGEPFSPFFSDVKINGVLRSGSYVDADHITLTASAGVLNNVPCRTYADIGHELTNFRLQGLAGSSEENFAMVFRPDGAWLTSSYAGLGKYRPVFVATGENPTGQPNPQISMYPNATVGQPGDLYLGGFSTTASIHVYMNYQFVNRLGATGSLAGNGPSLFAEGSDTNLDLNFAGKGSGGENHVRNRTNHVRLDGANTGGSPSISPVGSDNDIDFTIFGKGAGLARVLTAIKITAAAGIDRFARYMTNDVLRWGVGASNEGESGSNAGTNYVIVRYADNGTFLAVPFKIQRNDGRIVLGELAASTAYANDAAAAAAGIPIGGLYKNSSFGNCVKAREV